MTDFNCTIQELKHCSHDFKGIAHIDFNCTIQELKLPLSGKPESTDSLFQLHHTGIKTTTKTTVEEVVFDFNCTIQELKQ